MYFCRFDLVSFMHLLIRMSPPLTSCSQSIHRLHQGGS